MTALRTCPACHGSGEIHYEGYSLHPTARVRVRDPQLEVSERCRRCDGEGLVRAPRFERELS